MKKSIISSSALQTKHIAQDLAKTLLETQATKDARVLALAGELGSGKTTFTQGFAKGLGVKEKILSPTFILLKAFKIQHPSFRAFYHIDCYRLDSPVRELLHLGFKKIIADPRNIVLIEWADRIKPILPPNTPWVYFSHAKKGLTKRIMVVHEPYPYKISL